MHASYQAKSLQKENSWIKLELRMAILYNLAVEQQQRKQHSQEVSVDAEQIVGYIKAEKVQVTPVLDEDGVVTHWTAGRRRALHGFNYVPNYALARGATLEEAVANLRDGRTLYRLDAEGALIENS
jgi:hypothetical protein